MDDSKQNEHTSNKKGVGRNGNLIPPKKGEPSRNPKGRPKKGFAIADILNATGDLKAPAELSLQVRNQLGIKKKILTMRELMVMRAYLQAVKGDRDARNFITDRTEGKALERIAINVADSPFELWKSKIEDEG